VVWDPEKVAAGDPEALAAVAEAERIFDEYNRFGATAYKIEPGKPAEKMAQFDQTAENIVIVPRIAGG
jgi:hypothetical protein